MRAILPISSLLLSVSFLLAGHGLMGTLLPLRGLLEGYSSTELGLLGALYSVGFGIGTLFGPRAIGRVGHVRTFAAMAALVCITASLQGLFTEPVFWWLSRALAGYCLATLYIIIESWLNAASTNDNRGMVFSVYTVINLAVVTIGQLATTIAEIGGAALFTAGSILFAASVLPVSLTKTEAPTPPVSAKLRILHLWNLSPVAVFGALAIGLANGAFWTLGPIFAERETGGVAQVAVFMSATVISGAVGQLPFGWLSDRLDRRSVIAIAGACAAAAAIGHVFAARYMQIGIFPCATMFGLFAFPLYAICAAHLNDQVDDGNYTEAASGLLLLYAIGAVIGPMVASYLMDLYAPDALFIFTSVVHLTLVIFVVCRIFVNKSANSEEKLAFSESLVSAGTVANLDPRQETQ